MTDRNYVANKLTNDNEALRTVSNVCNCDHRTPRMYTFTSQGFVKTTSARLVDRGLSATQTIDWTLEELLDHHSGCLTGPDGKPVVFDTDDVVEIEKFDGAFRNDSRRFINHLKAKAQGTRTGKYRLQKRVIYPMMLLWFALENYDCRTTGKCSGNAKLNR